MCFKRIISCILLLVLGVIVQGQAAQAEEEEHDYYWNDYTGETPDDALPGGRDGEGKITYIGQTFHDHKTLIPGEIDTTTKALFYAMGKQQQVALHDIKILCARNHENYEWINTNITNIRFLIHKHLISGGYFDGYPTLIGRTEYEGRVVVGKVIVNHNDDWFAFDVHGKAKYVKTDFQVLTYNHNIPAKVTST